MLVQTFAEVVKTVCHDKHANICRAIYGSKYVFLCTFFLFPLSHFPFGNTLDEKEMKCPIIIIFNLLQPNQATWEWESVAVEVRVHACRHCQTSDEVPSDPCS